MQVKFKKSLLTLALAGATLGGAPALAQETVRWGIPMIAVIIAALFVAAVRFVSNGSRKATVLSAAGVLVWLGATALLALSGALLRFDLKPPPMALMFVVIIGGAIALGLSRVGGALAKLPLWVLVLAQGFRFPLELVMHEAAVSGVMPTQMSYTGFNYDIVTGVTALLLGGALYTRRAPPALVWIWNVWGCIALTAIAVVALASSPMLCAFGDDFPMGI